MRVFTCSALESGTDLLLYSIDTDATVRETADHLDNQAQDNKLSQDVGERRSAAELVLLCPAFYSSMFVNLLIKCDAHQTCRSNMPIYCSIDSKDHYSIIFALGMSSEIKTCFELIRKAESTSNY